MKHIRSGTRPIADNGADEFSFFDVRPDRPLPLSSVVLAGALVLAIGAAAGVLLFSWVL
jgi:hypothetical protein